VGGKRKMKKGRRNRHFTCEEKATAIEEKEGDSHAKCLSLLVFALFSDHRRTTLRWVI
jgi:hypothetical protein